MEHDASSEPQAVKAELHERSTQSPATCCCASRDRRAPSLSARSAACQERNVVAANWEDGRSLGLPDASLQLNFNISPPNPRQTAPACSIGSNARKAFAETRLDVAASANRQCCAPDSKLCDWYSISQIHELPAGAGTAVVPAAIRNHYCSNNVCSVKAGAVLDKSFKHFCCSACALTSNHLASAPAHLLHFS